VRFVLEDVLETCAADGKAYSAYSSADLRGILYKSFPNFTKERIRRKISVRVAAIGSGGGDAELAERRWLSKQEGAPTYVLIYGTKVASISLGQGSQPQVVITDDAALARTQQLIFDHVWEFLKPLICCGIVGYIGKRSALPILLDGLRALEYRGYDSAGLAFHDDGKLHGHQGGLAASTVWPKPSRSSRQKA